MKTISEPTTDWLCCCCMCNPNSANVWAGLMDINSLLGDELRSGILIPFTSHTISAGMPFRWENRGCGFTRLAPCSDHFLWHTLSARSDYSEWLGALHTERIMCRRLCSVPSAEPYCTCLLLPFPLDIRWPCHFTFLSFAVMNEVSGARCFLESSSKTAEAKASI